MSRVTVVEAVLMGALERPAGPSREAYLAEACQGEAALRAEVDELLKAHELGAARLEPPLAPADLDQTTSLETRTEAREVAGRIIADRYKLLEPIGEGGMGSVWLAEQFRPLRRKVAIKLVKAGMDSRQVLARFDAERQALAVMDHPNIARVLDGGATDDGRPYFVMEYVKGIPINDYCDQARLTIDDRLRLFIGVCEAVQHAHHKGIVHRDLKPSNVLVCLYDGKPVPKVIDFGLAKAMSQSLTEQTMFTAHGVVLGTPLYMSPEQATLNNLDVDTRTDVYSLGVILYELLTGTTPLEKQRLQQAAWHEMLRLIQEAEPPRASTRLSSQQTLPSLAAQRSTEPLRLSRMLRGELDWVLQKALEKDRARRYETPGALASDVERYLKGDIVQARPPSPGYRARKFFRKHRAGVLMATAFGLLLLAATAVSVWQAVAARQAEQQAIRSRNDAIKAREAESTARERSETQAYAMAVLDRRRRLDINSGDRAVFLELADLLRSPVPNGAEAWREHLALAVLLGGARFAESTRLHDRGGVLMDFAKLSGDQKQLLTWAQDQGVDLRAFPGLRLIKRLEEKVGTSKDGINTFDFLPGNRLIASLRDGGRQFLLLDAATGDPVGPPIVSDRPIAWYRPVGPSGRLLAGSGPAKQETSTATDSLPMEDVWLLEAGRAEPLARLKVRARTQLDVSYSRWPLAASKDGKWFALAGEKALEIRRAEDGSLIQEIEGDLDSTAMDVDDSSSYLALAVHPRSGTATGHSELRFYDTRDWKRPPLTTSFPPGTWLGNPSWLPASDRVVRLASAPDFSSAEQMGTVVRGQNEWLPHEFQAVAGHLALSADGQVLDLNTGERIAPAPGRIFAEQAREFAEDGRWLILPGLLVDLELNQSLQFASTTSASWRLQKMAQAGAGWAFLAHTSSDDDGASIDRFWAVPGQLLRGPAELIVTWAQLIACGRPDAKLGIQHFTPAESQAQEDRLRELMRQARTPEMPGFDTQDRLGWLRRCIGSETSVQAELRLLDQLVAAEPTVENLTARAACRYQLGDQIGMMHDVIDASHLDPPRAFTLALKRRLTLANFDWSWWDHPDDSVFKSSRNWNVDECRTLLAYIDTLERSGETAEERLSRLASTMRAIGYYRMRQFDEAKRALEWARLDPKSDVVPFAIVLRTMARYQLGETDDARTEFKAALAATTETSREECPALLKEAKILFGE